MTAAVLAIAAAWALGISNEELGTPNDVGAAIGAISFGLMAVCSILFEMGKR